MLKKQINFNNLIGVTIKSIEGLKVGSELVKFELWDDYHYEMFHEQSCCEQVSIEDIVGDVSDLIGEKIISSEEVSNQKEQGDKRFTWTFYKLGTKKGSITIRWYGSSNGYYAEKVSIFEVRKYCNEVDKCSHRIVRRYYGTEICDDCGGKRKLLPDLSDWTSWDKEDVARLECLFKT